MKSKLLTDLQWASDDSFFPLTADEIDASFIPGHEPGNAGASAVSSAPRGMLAATMPSSPAPGPMPDTISAQASLSGFTSVPITLGGITINLLFDVAAMSAPQSFREGIEQGATLLASAITDKITVNVNIDFDATAPNGSAGARPDGVGGLSYSLLRETLINHAAAGDTTFNALPGGASIPGFDPDSSKIIPQDDVWVYSAQEKLWGLLGANDTTTDDGQAIFGPNINPNLLASVALHELTHAFGRVPAIAGDVDIQAPDVFDLFRFVSPGVRLFQSYNGLPALPAYFSVDGGVTKLADYDQFSDPSDFLSRGVQGSTDPFDAFYTSDTNQLLTALDLEQMTALGFHMSSALPVTTTDMSGSTRLDQVGLYYYLDHMNAGAESGPLLKLNGAPVYQGELTTSFGAWKPIGAEQTATGYEVAWNVPGTDLYALWNTDAKGNFLSIGGNGGTMSGTSRDMELTEVGFQQDLNGDGHIGIVSVIESSGSTKLDLFANNYFLDPATGAGPSLKYNGVAVVSGQFGALAPIGAEQTASGGYEIAWKNATGAFSIWNTDDRGNYVFTILDHVAGTDATLQSQETFFQQDLNGDGHIGVVSVIESSGSTKLDLFANNYFLDPVTGAGPSLKYNGVAVVSGQFGTWAPIASEQTATGFDVAWKDSATGNFRVWTTDSTGNYTSTLLDNVAGSNTDFEALETTFNEDLNGDSVIGVWTIVESSGMIRSDLIGNHYFLDVRGAPPQSGPSLKDAGVPITPGFSGMNAIGAELLGTGYEVAFKAPGADLYSVWFTNSNGNHVSTLINAVSGTNWNLESAEWDFNQDLNGDGMIGLPAIETSGFTRLDLAENHYFLDSNSGAQGRR